MIAILIWMGSASAFSGPLLSILSISDNAPVGKYDKLEISFDLGKSYKNPFDPAEIDVTVELKSPSGLIREVKGFVYQDFQRTGDFNHQVLTPVGSLVWKARFAPNETGDWSYVIKAKDTVGGASSTSRSFTVRSSADRGFVRVSANDPDYFAFDNGDDYFPLGENIGWSSDGRTYQYDKWVGSLADNGGNFIRVWQANWHTEYEWAYSYPPTTLLPGNYMDRLKEAWELDYILNLCSQKKVYVMLCLINHGRFSTTNDSNWKDNPYSKKANPTGGFLDKPEEVWTSEKAKMYIQRNWRYLIARYAHYTSIHSWEMFNEMEWIDNYSASVTASAQFHQAMGDYLKSIDPYHHLLTTSYAHALKWPSDVWNAGMQFTQEHNYGGQDMAQVADNLTSEMRAQYPGKPFYIGEMGIGGAGGSEAKADPTGIFIHNTNWGSLTAKAAGGGFPWWWDSYVEPNNLYYRWKGIAAFTAGEDMDRRRYKPTAFEVSTPAMADFAVSPGRSDWGLKAPQNLFTISKDGSLIPSESNLTGYVYSKAKADFRNPPTFHVEPASRCKFSVKLGAISSWGQNNLTIMMDGKPTAVNNAPATANSVYEIEVTKGPHDLFVDSTGQDWVQVAAYSITNYVGALRCKALNGEGKVLGRVQSKSYTYSSKENPLIKGAVLHLDGLSQNGAWKMEWWDTEKGTKLAVKKFKVSGGAAALPLPAIDKDLAFKAVYTGGKSTKPSVKKK